MALSNRSKHHLQRNLMQHSVETSSAFVVPRELLQRFDFQRKRCLCSTVRRHMEFNPKKRVDDFVRDLFGRNQGRRNVSFGTVSKLVFDKLPEHSRVMFVEGMFDMKWWRIQEPITRLTQRCAFLEVGGCEAGPAGEMASVAVDGAEVSARCKTRRERLTQRRC